jgi:hypothetical protein
MPMNWQEIIDKTPNLTDEQKKMAAEVFGIESLTRGMEESAMHTANEAFAVQKKNLQESWDQASREYVEMQEKLQNHEATASELAAAKRDLAVATEKLKTANPNIDLDKLQNDMLTKLRAENASLELGARTMELDALECVAQHRELFGQNLSVKQLVQESLAAKKSPTEYWEERYKVPEKRTEVAKAAHDKELNDAREEGYKKRVAEEAHPATRALQPSKDPFWFPKPDAKEAQNPWDETGPAPEEAKLLEELQMARG